MDVDYLNEIKIAIRKLHGCEAVYLKMVPVKETFQGKTVWEGEVEVFQLLAFSKAQCCYAWGHTKANGGWEITTVLGISPIISPQTAVKAAIAAKIRSGS